MAKNPKNSKESRPALETTQTAEIAWLTNEWQEHPVVGLTPIKLHRLLVEAEQGNLQAQADLFSDIIERDGHIFSEMDKRIKGVNSLSWGYVRQKMLMILNVKLLKKCANGLMKLKILRCFF